MVSQLVKKAIRKPNFLKELMVMDQDKDTVREGVQELVVSLNKDDTFIDSVGTIQKAIKETKGEEIKQHVIRDVMKKDMAMSYKKVVPVSLQANSQRNLILRQQFGLTLISLLNRGKKILNVDETWLGMTDFRRRKWREKDTTNSVP